MTRARHFRTALCRNFAALLIASLFAIGCDGGESSSSSRPSDVIIIVLDTTRADRLGMYGHTRPVSPNLDRFAQDSVVFERAWSTASWTLPSHASLLTGQYPTSHGAHITPDTDADSNGENPAHLREEATTLAELLAARGYRRGAVAGAGWLSPEFGLMQGYELQDAVNNRDLPASEISSRALAWLEQIQPEEPVHLLVNYFDPHWPYEPIPPYDRYAKERAEVAIPNLHQLLSGTKTTPEQRAKMLDLYDGEIEYMDHHVGRLLQGLKDQGRYDNAMIVVIADHGEMLGEHGDLGHGAWLWEELVRIPLIVHYPKGAQAGRRQQASVSTVDVLAWVAKELGIELEHKIDGLPVGEREVVLAEEFPNQLFVKLGGESMNRNLVAAMRWPWKLIASTKGTRELFDIGSDPGEQAPIADEARRDEIDRALREELAQLVAPEPAAEGRQMSAEAIERLRELGYIE